jgi:hypothetical protein
MPGGRKAFVQQGGLMKSTIFQLQLLPVILAVGLLTTGNLWLIPCAIAAFLASRAAPAATTDFFTLIFPIICGAYFGDTLAVRLFSPSIFWHIVGIVIGMAIMFVIMSLVVALVSIPIPRR